jgi:hypothetical protein
MFEPLAVLPRVVDGVVPARAKSHVASCSVPSFLFPSCLSV